MTWKSGTPPELVRALELLERTTQATANGYDFLEKPQPDFVNEARALLDEYQAKPLYALSDPFAAFDPLVNALATETVEILKEHKVIPND